MTVHNRLKSCRHQHEMSQKEFAEYIGDFMRTMKQAPVKRENKTKQSGIKIRIG